MPYMREGKCVYHKNKDGTRGEVVKCHDTVEEAEAHLRALYANVSDAQRENKAQQMMLNMVAHYVKEEGMTVENALRRAIVELREAVGYDASGGEPIDALAAKTFDRLVAFGGEIKAVDEAQGRVGGYLVMWGDDSKRDLEGEFFTPETDFGLDWFPVRPVLYHHGLDKTLKHQRIGEITHIEADDEGLWVEAQLDLHKRYVQAIMELIKRGVVGWSSGTLAHIAQRDNGKITVWPIVEGSITPTPAEPRIRVVPLKSLVDVPTPEGLEAIGLGEDENDASDINGSNIESEEDSGAEHDELRHDGGSDMDPKEVAMAAINATLQALNVEGIADEDKQRLVESVLAHLQNAGEANAGVEKDAEEYGRAIGKAAVDVVKQFIDEMTAERAKREATVSALNAAKQAAANAGDQVQMDTPIKPGFDGERQPHIEVMSRYHGLSGPDMAFYATIVDGVSRIRGKTWQPSQPFLREMAAKTLKQSEELAPYMEARQGEVPAALKALQQIKADGGMKANEVMGTGQSGYGAEWIPDIWSSELWRTARIENKVISLLPVSDMPQDDWVIPVEGSDPVVYRVSQTTDDSQFNPASSPVTSSKAGTMNVTMSAKKIGARVPFSAEEDEDSIIRFIPELRRKVQRAMEDAMEYCVLHADTTTGTGNINKYDATVNASDTDRWLLGWDGIAHLPLVDDTTLLYNQQAARPDVDMMRGLRRKLYAPYMNDFQNLVYIVEPVTGTYLADIPAVLTVDKFGPNATILKGQLGAFDTIPIVTSAQFLQADDANGMLSDTASNNVFGRVLLVHRPSFRFGYRRRVTLELVRFPLADAFQVISYARIGFIRRDDVCASLAYNIAIS